MKPLKVTTPLMVLLSGSVFLWGCPPSSGHNPSVKFTADMTYGDAALSVQFTDSSTGGSAPITSWSWDFGDGITSTVQNPQHTYSDLGLYTVKLTVTTPTGTSTTSKNDYIQVYNPGASFSPGARTKEVSARISPVGGLIVSPMNSPLAGVTVEFSQGCFAVDTDLSLSSDSGVLTPLAGKPGPVALVIDTGAVPPQAEMKITLPTSNQQDELLLLFHIDDDGRLSPTTLVAVDSDAKTETFSTFQTGVFVWIIVPTATPGKTILNFDISTGFRPDRNGFDVGNPGTPPYTIGGDCYGMSGFAKWYFDTHREGHLAQAFVDLFPANFEPKVGRLPYQQIIATRAQQSLSLPTKEVRAENGNKWANIEDHVTFVTLYYSMCNTGKPTVLILSGPAGGHAVLAYQIQGNTIHVYDPNQPKLDTPIELGITGFDLSKIGNYTKLTHIDLTVPSWREPFETILYDAKNDFNGRSYSYIELVSPNVNEPLVEVFPTPPIVLRGKVGSSGIAAVTDIRVYANTEKQGILLPAAEAKVDFSLSRQFSLANLLLGPGRNFVTVETYTRHDPAPPNQVANPSLNLRLVGNNYEQVLESHQLILNVPLHIRVTPPTVNLDANSKSSQITVDSQEDIAWSAFPLRWKVSSVGDSRITVTPQQTIGNVTPVLISTSDANHSYDTTVKLTNLDNPTDVETVQVSIRGADHLPPPHVKLSTDFIGLNSATSERSIWVQTVETAPQGTLRWRVVSTDARIIVSPAYGSSNQTQVKITTSDPNSDISANVRFENLDNLGDSTTAHVVVNNPLPEEKEIRGIWGVGGNYDLRADINEYSRIDRNSGIPCPFWQTHSLSLAVSAGHFSKTKIESYDESGCSAQNPEACYGEESFTETWESTYFSRDSEGRLIKMIVHYTYKHEATCLPGLSDTYSYDFVWPKVRD